jgi:hypothetical protein
VPSDHGLDGVGDGEDMMMGDGDGGADAEVDGGGVPDYVEVEDRGWKVEERDYRAEVSLNSNPCGTLTCVAAVYTYDSLTAFASAISPVPRNIDTTHPLPSSSLSASPSGEYCRVCDSLF